MGKSPVGALLNTKIRVFKVFFRKAETKKKKNPSVCLHRGGRRWYFFFFFCLKTFAQTPLGYGLYSLFLKVTKRSKRQILFISGEQLSLIVAGDSAKTLSVLENMGGALDDCGLRFVQKCHSPPQNTPDFGGPTDFFGKLPKKDPYRNHTKSMN